MQNEAEPVCRKTCRDILFLCFLVCERLQMFFFSDGRHDT